MNFVTIKKTFIFFMMLFSSLIIQAQEIIKEAAELTVEKLDTNQRKKIDTAILYLLIKI